jgi:5-methylcytosine-specific restriction endonuclease McrA
MARKGITTRKRKEVHGKFGGRCAYCGELITQKAMQVDHVKPVYLNGSNADDNLFPACFACNNYKLTFSIEELRHQISMQVERARKNSVNFRLAERYGLIEITNKPVVFYFEKF